MYPRFVIFPFCSLIFWRPRPAPCALVHYTTLHYFRPVQKRPAVEPRPRWEVLRVLNYLVIALFVCSITYVVFNYRTMSHAETGNGGLFPILVIW